MNLSFTSLGRFASVYVQRTKKGTSAPATTADDITDPSPIVTPNLV